MATLHLRSSAGDTNIPVGELESIGDALRRFGIPLSAVQPYSVSGDRLRPVSLLSRVGAAGDSIVAYLTRNIPLKARAAADWPVNASSSMATEYLAPTHGAPGLPDVTLVQLGPGEILQLGKTAMDAVIGPLRAAARPSGRVIVGVSGGGDSNFLLAALSDPDVRREVEILPVMVLGIEDWDTQRENAQHLCDNYGFQLTILSPEQSSRYCGLDSVAAALARYEHEFPQSGREFFGTWLLRRALTGHAHERSSTVVMLGGNREDALAEALLLLSQGRKPLPMPFRNVAGTTFVNPLWELPKKVIDAAFPRFSVQNYEARQDSMDRGRTMYYLLAHAIQDVGLGLDLSLLRGIQQLASDSAYQWDDALQDIVVAGADAEVSARWRRVLRPGGEDEPFQPVHAQD